MKFKLPGLEIADFMHPYEEEKKVIFSSLCTQAIIQNMNQLSISLMKPFVDGVYIKATAASHARIYRILYDVCEILDYRGKIPQICIAHNAANNISPCGCDDLFYITISDYTLEKFDDDMMYYSLGNAVAMMKAGHVELATISAYFPSYLMLDIIKKPFMDYIHAADATSDRGGLLACQSFKAAAKCHLFELGLPVSEAEALICTEAQAVSYVGKYQECYKKSQRTMKNTVTKISALWNDTKYIEGAGNKMLCDLFNWYMNPGGYAAIMKKYGRR